jgi:Protein of unknown function (DUF3833)
MEGITMSTLLQRRLFIAATSATALGLAGCSSAPQVADYANEKPVFDLKNYFSGVVDGWGIFTDRAGKVARRFIVTMNCSWNGDEGILDEDFVYSDGKKEKRIWRMKRIAGADGIVRYEGKADDVVGTGLGEQRGNAFRWGYTLALPVDGKVYEVQFDDWMYQMDSKVVINKATMSKFGITLGELVVTFTKRS